MSSHEQSFRCFGGTVRLQVAGTGAAGEGPEITAARIERRLLDIHSRLSRFIPDSELEQVNRDARETVPASPLMRRFAVAVRTAGERSGGLVDATKLDSVRRAGYSQSLVGAPGIPLAEILTAGAPRRAASADPERRWASIAVDDAAETISRPPGVKLDSGGIAKGLAADLVSAELRNHAAFSVDCCGDVRMGGRAGLPRTVQVESPDGSQTVCDFELARGGVATSGIGRRSWRDDRGAPAHHLLDPSSGAPAYTGLVQATAIAPTALLAEIYAKAAVLSGPEHAADWLPHGGVIVDEHGTSRVIEGASAHRRPVRTS